MTQLLRCLALALGLAITMAACTGRSVDTVGDRTTAPTSPAGAVLTDLKIAFVADLSQDGASQRIAPALQGTRLAVDAAGRRGAALQVVPFDTDGTTAGIRDVADSIVADPTVVAVIVGPQLSGQISLGERLDSAGVPTISLSTLGPDLPDQGWAAWQRAVPDIDAEARTLVASIRALAGPTRVCLLGDGSAASAALLRAVRDELPAPPALRLGLQDTDPDDPRVVSAIRDAGCRSVVWGGTPTGGGLLRLALVAAGLRSVRLFGGESLKDASFITTAGPRGRGTVAVCPCVDLSTSTGLRAQRFIQDYQSSFGVSPGAFAAEAWDMAGVLVDAIRSGAADRAEVAEVLSRTTTVDGLARTYAFASDGSLRGEARAVFVYRDVGVRWIRAADGSAP